VSASRRGGHARLARWLARPASAFAVGLVVRLAAILVLGFYQDPETWENGEIATHIWNGEGFSGSFGRDVEPTSFQGPAYPYLLVAVWSVFGRGPAGYLFLSLLHAVAVSSMVFPLHALTRRWFGAVPATLAIWVFTFAPIYVWFPTRIHHSALLFAVHPWLVYGWLRLADDTAAGTPARPRWRVAAGTGTLTAIGALFQPVLLPCYGLISGVLLVRRLVSGRSAEATAILAAGLLTLVLLAPWTVRNHAVHGRFVPVKNGFPKELWMGNNPHATGTSFAEGGEIEITIAHPPRAFALRGQVSEMELLDALQAEAMEYIRADPAAFVARSLRKVAWFWTHPPSRIARSYGDATVYVHSAHLGYWLVFLALFGLAAGTRQTPREYLAVVAVFVAVFSLVHGLTHMGQPRQRAEVEFIFLPGVGAGAAWILAKLWPSAHADLVAAGSRSGPA
jgi:hypothetical protein